MREIRKTQRNDNNKTERNFKKVFIKHVNFLENIENTKCFDDIFVEILRKFDQIYKN